MFNAANSIASFVISVSDISRRIKIRADKKATPKENQNHEIDTKPFKQCFPLSRNRNLNDSRSHLEHRIKKHTEIGTNHTTPLD